MSAPPTTNGLNLVAVAVVAVVVWYLYQIGSRKTERIRYKVKRAIVALLVYAISVSILLKQGLPVLEIALISGLAAMGCAWLFVNAPKRGRRISTRIRREVIERDLTSKGLKWDPTKYHIDHVVPFSKGGDHSARNLRVLEKTKNLQKAGRMPGFRDFLQR